MLNSFPIGSIIFGDTHVVDMKALSVIDSFPSQVSIAEEMRVPNNQKLST